MSFSIVKSSRRLLYRLSDYQFSTFLAIDMRDLEAAHSHCYAFLPSSTLSTPASEVTRE